MKLREEVFQILIGILNDYYYCFLRNYEILPEYTNDIDILVEKGATKKILLKLIEKFEKEEVIHLYNAQFSCLSIYFYDEKVEQIIHLDFFEEIKWKVFEYLPATEVLKTRIKYKNFFVPHPLYEMYELLLTRLIYQGKIKEVYKDRIFSLYQRINGEIPFKYKFNFDTEIASQSWGEIEKRITTIRTKLIFSNILKPIKLSKHIFLFLKRIFQRLINPPGLFIILCGVDGSGKTTQINLLSENLRGIYSDKIRLFHFRPSIFYKKPQNDTVINPHDQLKSNYIRDLIKLFYYIFIYNYGFLIQVLPFVAKNGLVIFDRYYYDLLVDQKRFRMNLPQNLIKFFSHFIPKPDLIFFLDTNPEIAFARKRELNIKELERQGNEFYNLKNLLGDRFSIILNNSDVSSTVHNIIEIIFQYLGNRTQSRIKL